MSTDSALPAPSRLPILRPRDLRAEANRPCDLLRAQQLSRFGLSAPGRGQQSIPGLFTCTYEGVGPGKRLDLQPYGDRDVLGMAYRRPLFPLVRASALEGLPILVQQSFVGAVNCTVTVGVADSQGFDVTFTYREGDRAQQDPCARAVEAADAVVSNLPPLH